VRCKSPLQADKILAAAARLFATHRFHEARMEDIAADAEVGKGTLYRYFKDKEELYRALLARAAEGLQARLREALATPGTPRDRLVAVVAALLGYFDEQPHLLDLIQHAEAMQKPGQEFSWQKTRNQTTALVQELFQAGKREGVFAVDDAPLACLMLLGGLRAVLRFGIRPRPADIAERIVSGLLGGYAGHGSEAQVRCDKRPLGVAQSPPPIPPGLQIIDGASSPLHNA
jgi:AcrR family transcriptional regulator